MTARPLKLAAQPQVGAQPSTPSEAARMSHVLHQLALIEATTGLKLLVVAYDTGARRLSVGQRAHDFQVDVRRADDGRTAFVIALTPEAS